MSLALSSEKYNALDSIYANALDYITGSLTVYGRTDYLSEEFARATYNNVAGNFTITIPVGDSWENYGFAVGDSIEMVSNWVYNDGSGTYSQVQTWTRTIIYLTGNVMHISAALFTAGGGGGTPPVGEVVNGREFPTDSIYNRFTGLSIIKTAASEELEFSFNLTPNGSTSLNSVIDGELMRFKYAAIDSMVVLDVVPLVQQGDKSGGYFMYATITFDAHDVVNHYRTYTLDYKIVQWGVIQDGFTEPNYYAGTDNLAPIANIKLFGQVGNPNTMFEVTSQNTEANTGGYDENYNGGVNIYSLGSTSWTDFLGNPIDGMDYSNECTFVTTINATGQDTVQSKYRIGLIFRPFDSSVYKNLPNPIVNNLVANIPDVDFNHSLVPDPTIYPGFLNDDGAGLDITDLLFTIIGGTVMISGKVIPNTIAKTYFDQFPDTTRKTTLHVSIGDYLVDDTELSKRVSLKIYDQDIIDAPLLGVQIPDVETSVMFDHAGNVTVKPTLFFQSEITTEDDVLYQATLKLIDNIAYEGMRVKISAYSGILSREFTLEEFTFSFASVVNIAGQFQPNIILNRSFNLPPSSDRNLVSLTRQPALDEPGKYGVQIDYGFLSRWEYWLKQLNMDNDFFDITEPLDGKNKNWEKVTANPSWLMRMSVFTTVNGVEDFNRHPFKIRPYEDEDVTTVVTYLVLSDGTTPTSLIDDETIQVTVVETWNAGVYLNSWAEATIEDFESGNRWAISSVLPHGGESSNPLKNISGDPTVVGVDFNTVANVATSIFIIDTSLVDVSKVSVGSRVRSEPLQGKMKTDDTIKQKTDGTVKQKAE